MKWFYLLLGLSAAVFVYSLSQKKPNPPVIINYPASSIPASSSVQIIAQNLHIPWDLVFLPDGSMLVTERRGRLLKINKETKVISEIKGVRHYGEGGLMGMVLHPRFAQNHFLYLYYTTSQGNQVERYVFQNDSLSDPKIIISGIKSSQNHDGGRLAFGPDGYLYITTGDAEDSRLAQDKNSLNGKILRLKEDGSIPADNPVGNAVYSFGHRNSQGLAWDSSGNLWSTEHGPSGLQTGFDELNLITKGANYGWPVIKGDQQKDGLTSPILQSGIDQTWAPAGLVYWQGSLYFAGLRGQSLYQAKIDGTKVVRFTRHLTNIYGRLRTVVLGPDGYFYLTTSNEDGRGNAKPGDDQIIKINPADLK